MRELFLEVRSNTNVRKIASETQIVRLMSAFLEMCKLRMVFMIWVTIIFGYLLATGFELVNLFVLGNTLLFSGLSAAGSFILNQHLEIDVDSKMPRTQNRPLPLGVFSPAFALNIGLGMFVSGLVALHFLAGFLPMILTAFIGISYVWIYTPLKRISWWNTTVGAVPGAIPPMVGWAAATGELSVVAWVLFLVMFVWQHPHFYAIGWLYREDYRAGGLHVLPGGKNGSFWTSAQTIFFAVALIPVTWSLYYLELTSLTYFVGVTFIGLIFLYHSIRFALLKNKKTARQLLFSSLLYLPVFLLLLSVDSRFSIWF